MNETDRISMMALSQATGIPPIALQAALKGSPITAPRTQFIEAFCTPEAGALLFQQTDSKEERVVIVRRWIEAVSTPEEWNHLARTAWIVIEENAYVSALFQSKLRQTLYRVARSGDWETIVKWYQSNLLTPDMWDEFTATLIDRCAHLTEALYVLEQCNEEFASLRGDNGSVGSRAECAPLPAGVNVLSRVCNCKWAMKAVAQKIAEHALKETPEKITQCLQILAHACLFDPENPSMQVLVQMALHPPQGALVEVSAEIRTEA